MTVVKKKWQYGFKMTKEVPACQILRIHWQDHVRNDEVAAHTGLRPVMESIKRRREAIFGHVARGHPTFQLTKHCDYRSRHHSVDNLTVIGSAALVAPTTAGSTNSARTISAHLLTYSEQPSSVVTLERRYGPRRLRDDDDDDMTYRHTSEAHRRKLLLGRWARAPTFCPTVFTLFINTPARKNSSVHTNLALRSLAAVRLIIKTYVNSTTHGSLQCHRSTSCSLTRPTLTARRAVAV